MTRWGRAVTPENVHREYPRPTLVREWWLNLNGLWQFAPAKEGESPPIGRDLPERILVPFPVESALSGIGRHEVRMWYRRTFDLPADWQSLGPRQRVILHLDAVDWEATVLVNGANVGTHRGGYDRISFDITEALRTAGPQEIIVGVWDPTDAHWQPRGKQVLTPRGIWYTPSSGIWQTAWIEPVPEAHIRAVGTSFDPSRRAVEIRVDGGESAIITRATVMLGESVVGSASGPSPLSVPVAEPKLWSPEHPVLYRLKVAIAADEAPERVLDEAETMLALRTVGVHADARGSPRLALNGEPVFLVGPLDQGFWPDGLSTPPSDEAMIFDIQSMKRLGFNAVRKHVKVEPERWYFHCDRLGLLVLQDMPSGDAAIGPSDADFTRSPESADQFEAELRRLIEGRGMHPSIVTWVIFNEGWGQSDTARCTDLVRALDPARLVISASGWTDRGCGDVLDLHTYPGPGPIPPVDRWGGRACILGEFGGLGLAIEGHTWKLEHWGYKGAADRDDLTFQYVELLRRLWDLKDRGLSGGIYTQLTDVETECNGLLTYDREVMKVDADRAARAARGHFPRVEVVVPTSRDGPAPWRYLPISPEALDADARRSWTAPGFDDGAWRVGPGGFGTRGTPGAVVRTGWSTPDILIRRTFELEARPGGTLALLMHHDEDAEAYLNGVLAAKVTGYTTDYTIVPITPEAAAALRPGSNTLAIHCRQTAGGQYIDAGIVRLIEKEE